MIENYLKDEQKRMDKSVEWLHHEYGGLRTGRASPTLLEPIKVNAYGTLMPLHQLATVSVSDARTLTVQVWDASQADATEKAIRESNLGLNPMRDGALIRVPLPELSKERREELAKVAARYAEDARVSIRNVRRDVLDHLKKMQKNGEISEDDLKKASNDAQKITDAHIAAVDDSFKKKQADILSVG